MYEEKPGTTKEWKLIESLLHKAMDERRKTRRWGIFFKGLTFAYLFIALWMFSSDDWSSDITKGAAHTAVVDISGIIAAEEEANCDNIVLGLRSAFSNEFSKGVVLRINSPGGSPVQAGCVYQEILRLRDLYPEKKIYSAISDIGASGAYYIAAATDQIYSDQASIVGSIGVVSEGFGFSELLGKVGVERRVMAAGTHKAMLDPFSPTEPADVAKFEKMLDTVHQQFISRVKKGRGSRLIESEEMFSGLFWAGEQALKMGLIDGFGSAGYIAREVVETERMVNYTVTADPFEKFVDRLGVSVAKGLAMASAAKPLGLK